MGFCDHDGLIHRAIRAYSAFCRANGRAFMPPTPGASEVHRSPSSVTVVLHNAQTLSVALHERCLNELQVALAAYRYDPTRDRLVRVAPR